VQAAVKFGMRRLELVPDFRLGPAGDLTPEPFPPGPNPTEIAPTKRFFAASK
jgi:hypothetical protein